MPKCQKNSKFDMVPPTDENHHCIFKKEFEDDPLIAFHVTLKSDYDSICEEGFLSGKELGTSDCETSSFAKRSSTCLEHRRNNCMVDKEVVVFAVEFENLEDKNAISHDLVDIHINPKLIRPKILGYCEIPKGRKFL